MCFPYAFAIMEEEQKARMNNKHDVTPGYIYMFVRGLTSPSPLEFSSSDPPPFRSSLFFFFFTARTNFYPARAILVTIFVNACV